MCNWQSSSVRAATFRNEICPDGAGQSGKREMDSSREKKGCHVQTTKPHALLDKSLTCVALEIITNKNLENLQKKWSRTRSANWKDVAGGKGKQTVINYIWKYQPKPSRGRVGIPGLITHLLYDFIEHSKHSRIRLRLPFRRAQPPKEPDTVCFSYAQLNYGKLYVVAFTSSHDVSLGLNLITSYYGIYMTLPDNTQPHWECVFVCVCVRVEGD